MTAEFGALLLFLFALASSRLLSGPCARWAIRVGHIDRPAGRKDHAVATPLSGGLPVLLPFMGLASVALCCAYGQLLWSASLPTLLVEHAQGLRAQALPVLALIFGSALLFVVGAIDDRRGVPIVVRLLVQVVAALLLLLADLRVTLFLPDAWMHATATILFVVFLTNATNFIDNMNGAMAGVVYLGTAQLLAIAVATGQHFIAGGAAVLAGGLLGFLPSNYPKAKAFIGDAGSTSTGFLLAGLTVAVDFHAGPFAFDPILLPLCALFVPFADGLLVCSTRILRGQSPFTGGHDHLAHRIVRRGYSRPHAVLWLWLLSALPSLFILLYTEGDRMRAAIVMGLAFFALSPLVLRGLRNHEEKT